MTPDTIAALREAAGREMRHRREGGWLTAGCWISPQDVLSLLDERDRLREALKSITKVRVDGDDNIWAGRDKCSKIAHQALCEDQ